MAPHMILKLPFRHEDSEYVISFEIGQREGSFYSARRHTDGQTDTPSTVLVHRLLCPLVLQKGSSIQVAILVITMIMLTRSLERIFNSRR